jgi:hypothetical protein
MPANWCPMPATGVAPPQPDLMHGNGYVEDCGWFSDRMNGLFCCGAQIRAPPISQQHGYTSAKPSPRRGPSHNGRRQRLQRTGDGDITATGGCPKVNINALKDRVCHSVRCDALEASAQGWLKLGTAIHREDLEALEKLEHLTVSDCHVLLPYWTLEAARRARRPAKGNRVCRLSRRRCVLPNSIESAG